jgi:hypothetical protein
VARPSISYAPRTNYVSPRYTQPSNYAYPATSTCVTPSYPTQIHQGSVASSPSQPQVVTATAVPSTPVRETGAVQPATSQRPAQTAASPGAAVARTSGGNAGQANSQPTTVRTTQTVPAETGASSTPERSALEMLAALSAKESTRSAEPQQTSESEVQSTVLPELDPAPTNATHIGSWTATLPNDRSVTLELQENGQFSWTAVREGKASTFRGEYALNNGQLKLVRSSDRQELKGSWSGDATTGFNFKLNGAKDKGLDFVRG